MTRESQGSGSWEDIHGSHTPEHAPVPSPQAGDSPTSGSPYAQPAPSPYAYPGNYPTSGSPYAQPAPSPYAYPGNYPTSGSPYAQPAPSPYAYPGNYPTSGSPYAEPVPSPYAQPTSGSPYAEPLGASGFAPPRQRVPLPSEQPPRRWPWMVTAGVSLVVIGIAIAVMVRNLSEPSSPAPQAGSSSSASTISPVSSSKRSQPSQDSHPAPDNPEPPEGAPDNAPPTVEITPEHTPESSTSTSSRTVAPKPPVVKKESLEEGEVRVPNVRGTNAQAAQNRLRSLGFTNIQLVPDNPKDGTVLFAAGWRAVSVSPSPGEVVDVDDEVTIRCVPIN